MADLQAMKALSKARDMEGKRLQERRRNTVILIMRHLCDYGYVETYERLCAESALSLSRADAADNMDLLQILQEFEDSYEMKYGKRPKLTRRVVEEASVALPNAFLCCCSICCLWLARICHYLRSHRPDPFLSAVFENMSCKLTHAAASAKTRPTNRVLFHFHSNDPTTFSTSLEAA